MEDVHRIYGTFWYVLRVPQCVVHVFNRYVPLCSFELCSGTNEVTLPIDALDNPTRIVCVYKEHMCFVLLYVFCAQTWPAIRGSFSGGSAVTESWCLCWSPHMTRATMSSYISLPASVCLFELAALESGQDC